MEIFESDFKLVFESHVIFISGQRMIRIGSLSMKKLNQRNLAQLFINDRLRRFLLQITYKHTAKIIYFGISGIKFLFTAIILYLMAIISVITSDKLNNISTYNFPDRRKIPIAFQTKKKMLMYNANLIILE